MFKKIQANWPVIMIWIASAAVVALLTGIPYEAGFGWQVVFWMVGIPFCALAGVGVATLSYAFWKGNFPEMHGENPFKFR